MVTVQGSNMHAKKGRRKNPLSVFPSPGGGCGLEGFSFFRGRVRLHVVYKLIGNSYKTKFVCSLFVGVLYCQITKPCLCGK